MLMLFSVCVSHGQNTKGDQPSQNRESRFKTPFKKSSSKRRPKTGKRVRAKESIASRASRSRTGRGPSGRDKPGKPIRPIAATSPQTKQRAWKGDIAGYRIRAPRSNSGSSRKNVYPQYDRYVPSPQSTEHPVSNRTVLAKLRRLESRGGPTPRRSGRVVPRSASRSFIARKSINVYANFPRPKRRGERASTRDISGRPLRKKNFESPRPGVVQPTSPFSGRRPGGDRPYKGQTLGGYRTASRGGKAWTGDIAGRRIRGRNFSSKRSIEGTPVLPSGMNRSATRPGESRPGSRLPALVPGIGASGIARYKGDLKAGRPFKGGGSRSGKLWNNNQQPVIGSPPVQGGRAALFQGNVRARKPFKGGGSVSGRLWNNNQQPLVGNPPLQGGRAALFQGNVKARKPFKGGGSVSGRLWNNNQQPLVVNRPAQGARDASFQGNIRVRKPEKGMPDVAGALPRAGLTKEGKKISGYPGKYKLFEIQPGFGDMGETFTGYIKLKKFRKNYVQHPNAADESTLKRRLKKSAYDAEGLIVKRKQRDYIQNEHSADESLKKAKPSSNAYLAEGLQIKVRQAEYGRKPKAAEGSLPGIKPSKTSVKANEYARSVRRNWDYIRNPSSAEEALKTREPGKAFAKVSAFQGNVKMHKYVLFEKNRASHPDTKFIKLNKNNVDEERDMLTNLKLWWARLFKKEETQPENLKYKGKKPRYDKGEQGMWYD